MEIYDIMREMTQESEFLLKAMFDAMVAAAQPARCLPFHLPARPAGCLIVLGAGKAAAAMARAVEQHCGGPLSGLVVTRYGHALETKWIEVIEASHPVPDAAGVDGARRILAMAEDAGADDLLLVLISGGGSALLTLPAAGLSLADKQAVNRDLLASGAAIGEINIVRKHLSAIKGGRLAATAWPARVRCLMISDVPGDDMAAIASGPAVADPTTFADARAVLARYGIEPPAAVARHLQAAGEETPKPGDQRLANVESQIVAAPGTALAAAADVARRAGYAVEILGDDLEDEARRLAGDHADLARRAREAGRSIVLLSGGEVTVRLTGDGRGGPNGEYALALALALDSLDKVHAMACDSDGIDGSEDNAGAVIAPDTLARGRARGLDAAEHLARNNSYGFFSALGDLVVTGPTYTNVNDFRAIVVE